MRRGIMVWGNAERLPAEGFEAIRGRLPFEIVEYANGSLNIEHQGLRMDEDVLEEAAQAIAGALSATGFGQLDLIDHEADCVLRFAIEPGQVRSRRTGTDNVLEDYHHE